jgi:hypothetical protein
MPDDGIPAGNYSVVLTAIDSHGSRSTSTSTLRVAACAAPVGNRAPTAIIGGPYTLPLCNGVGSIVMDASSSFDADVGDKVMGLTWEISSSTSDFELKLTGPSVTVSGGLGLYAGNTYEVRPEVLTRAE